MVGAVNCFIWMSSLRWKKRIVDEAGSFPCVLCVARRGHLVQGVGFRDFPVIAQMCVFPITCLCMYEMHPFVHRTFVQICVR